MEKQKAINDMAMDMFIHHHFETIQKARECATTLFELHYGDIPQALTEFAEKLKAKQQSHNFDNIHCVKVSDIDKTLKELLR